MTKMHADSLADLVRMFDLLGEMPADNEREETRVSVER